MLVVIQYGDIWAFGGCGCRGGWGRAPVGYTQNPLVTCHYLGAYRRGAGFSLWFAASGSIAVGLAHCGGLRSSRAGLVCTSTAVADLFVYDFGACCAWASITVAQQFVRYPAETIIRCCLAMVVAQRIQSIFWLVVLGQYGLICRHGSI